MKFLRNYSLRDNSDYETEDKGTDLCVMSLVLKSLEATKLFPRSDNRESASGTIAICLESELLNSDKYVCN